MVIGSRHPWTPRFLLRLGVSEDKVAAAGKRMRGVTRRIDALVGPRLSWAAGGLAQRLAGVATLAAAITMPPLELLPFAAALPASAVLLFGLGLTARDGLLMLIGFAATGGTAALVVHNAPRLAELLT